MVLETLVLSLLILLGVGGAPEPPVATDPSVIVELFDHKGEYLASICGTAIDGHRVLVARHALLGARSAMVNFGDEGLRACNGVCAASETEDVAILALSDNLPRSYSPLPPSENDPKCGDSISVVYRDRNGKLQTLEGECRGWRFDLGVPRLITDLQSAPGMSGASVRDATGGLVGIIVQGQGGTDNSSGLVSVVSKAALARKDFKALTEWWSVVAGEQFGEYVTSQSAGHRFGREGKLEEAARAFRRACEMRPASFDAAHWLVWALDSQSLTREAEDAAAAFARQNPQESRMWLVLGHVRLRRGDFESALSAYEQATKLSETGESLYWTAVAQYRLGRMNQAMDSADRARRSEPRHTNALLLLDRISESRDASLALASRRGLVDAEPCNPANVVLLANLLAQLGRKDELEALRDEHKGSNVFLANRLTAIIEQMGAGEEPSDRE